MSQTFILSLLNFLNVISGAKSQNRLKFFTHCPNNSMKKMSQPVPPDKILEDAIKRWQADPFTYFLRTGKPPAWLSSSKNKTKQGQARKAICNALYGCSQN